MLFNIIGLIAGPMMIQSSYDLVAGLGWVWTITAGLGMLWFLIALIISLFQ